MNAISIIMLDFTAVEAGDDKLKAFGFEVAVVDGHDFEPLEAAFAQARATKGKPFGIIMQTTKGKGVSYMENQAGWHGKAPNDEEYAIAMAELKAQLAEIEDEARDAYAIKQENERLRAALDLSETNEDYKLVDAYIISTGCAGSAMGSTVMGDMFVISTAVDYDLGHHADIREMEEQTAETWFRDESFTRCIFC